MSLTDAQKEIERLSQLLAALRGENTHLKEALGGGVVLSAKDGHFEAMASCPLCGHAGHPHGWAPGRCAQADCPCVVVHVLVARMPAVTGATSVSDAPTAPKASEIASDSSALEKALGALRELLRLYDWRFRLAEREKDPRNATAPAFEAETRRMLRQYGLEKKIAWEAARTILAGGAHVDGPKAPSDE